MTFFRFEDPWFLLLLLFLPIMVWQERRTVTAVHYSSLTALKMVRSHRSEVMATIPSFLRFIAITLFIVAFARPQEGHKKTEILSEGVDIVLALDTSGSMRALDFKKDDEPVTRLTVVKDVVAEFIDGRKTDRMGMVVFGGEAFTQCPLTLDHDILFSFLDKLKIGMAGDATAIGSAIGISIKRLKDLKSKSKVIILLTDGRNTAGKITPLQAVELAKTFGIKIYTVGVGKRGKAPFLVDSLFGKRLIYQNVDIDEKTLTKISEMTDAKYFRATDLESLKDIYEQIDQLETSEVRVLDHSEYTEMFHYFLIPGLFLLLTEVIISNSILRRIP